MCFHKKNECSLQLKANIHKCKCITVNEQASEASSEKLNLEEEKKPEDEETVKDYYNDIMKIPIWILRGLGLYHKKSDNIIIKAYCLLINVILWFTFLKMLTVFDFVKGKSESLSAKLFMKICFTIWSFICAILSTMIFLNQEFKNREKDLETQINLLYHFYSEKKIQKDRKFCLKINLFLILSIVFALFNCIFMFLAMFGIPAFFIAFSPLVAPFEDTKFGKTNIPFKFFMTIFGCISSFSWFLTTFYYISHCYILLRFLQDFNEKFEKFIKQSILVSNKSEKLNKKVTCCFKENIYFQTLEKLFVSEEDLDYYRIWHLKLSNAIRILDNCYNQFLGFAILLYTILSLILIYLMIDWNGNCIVGVLQIMIPYWALGSFCMLFAKITLAAKLNSKVKIKKNFISFYN